MAAVKDQFKAERTDFSIDWNDVTSPGMYPILMNGTSNPNGPGGAYFKPYGIYPSSRGYRMK